MTGEIQRKKTSTRSIRMRRDGIVQIRYLTGARETGQGAREGIIRGLAITGGRKSPVLLDMRPMQSMDHEARHLYAENARLNDAAVALLADSAFTRMLAGFYFDLIRDLVPARIFEREEEAIQWLKEFS